MEEPIALEAKSVTMAHKKVGTLTPFMSMNNVCNPPLMAVGCTMGVLSKRIK
jgi:hypothetical protein